MANQVTRPTKRKEFMDKLVVPYVETAGNPNQVFSEPQKLGQPEHNRAFETSLRGDTDKDFYIGIKDFDEAVKYYFDNVLKLSVLQNNTNVMVPTLYGNQENWKSIQLDGYLNDLIIYNVAGTSSQISAVYTATKSKYYTYIIFMYI